MQVHGGDIYTYGEVLDFSSNINPLGMPESVIEGGVKGVLESTGYPDIRKRDLLAGISEKEGVEEGRIICGNGAAEVLFALAGVSRPKKALLLAPAFSEYEQSLDSVGCVTEFYDLKEEKDFQLEVDYLEHLTEDLDIIYLCNPNNPTGQVVERGLLLKILEICEEKDILMVVDECFNDFLREPEEYTLSGFVPQYKNLFVLKAFTKIYGMPGLRLGYGLSGDEELISQMKENTQPWNVSLPAQMAGIAALKEKTFLKETRQLIHEERAYLSEGLDALGYRVFGSKANFLFFKGGENLFEQCLTKGILIRDCSSFRNLSKGYYRIAVKKHEDNRKLLKALKEIVDNG